MTDRSALLQYKGNRCASCGLSVSEMLDRHGTFERIFEFHHVEPSSKDRHYKRLMSQRLSRRKLDEMDKCVLLCRTCHGIVHAQNLRAQLTLSIDLRGRTVSQTIPGWVKSDRVLNSLTFVTNQRYTLHPCRVEFADGTSILLTVGEVSTKVAAWMLDMASLRELRVIRMQDGKVVYTMSHAGPRSVHIDQLIQFPVMELEYQELEPPKEVVFLRNGFALMKSGDILSAGNIKFTLNIRDELFVTPAKIAEK